MEEIPTSSAYPSSSSSSVLPALESDDYLTVLICSANVGNAEPTPSSFGEWIPKDGEVVSTILGTKYPVMTIDAEDSDDDNNDNKKEDVENNNLNLEASEIRELKKIKKMLQKLEKSEKKFDIIVMGMQEAAFAEKSKKKQQAAANAATTATTAADNNNNSNNNLLDISEADSERGGEFAEDHTTINNGNGTTAQQRRSFSLGKGEWDDDGANNIQSTSLVSNNSSAAGEKEGKSKKKKTPNPKKMLKQVIKANLLVRGLTSSQAYKRNPTLRNKNSKEKNIVSSKLKDITAPTSYDSRKFRELIANQCPSYELVVSFLRGEMRLFILALTSVADEIGDGVCINAENTGIGSIMANKGGIIATITLRKTRLSFMTAHLEAHEGLTHYMHRNKNIAEILAGAKPDPNYNLHDASILSHHMFVCGDLNYRIRLNNGSNGGGGDDDGDAGLVRKNSKGFAGKSLKMKKLETKSSLGSDSDGNKSEGNEESSENAPKRRSRGRESFKALKQISLRRLLTSGDDEVKEGEGNGDNGSFFQQAKNLVENENWDELNRGDELAMALKNKDCLVGFQTLPCNWPPTFKVARAEGYQYNEKRTPSYTDRILWHSTDGMRDNVMPFLYEPSPGFITSDHKPIRGAFAVKMNDRPSQSTQPNNSISNLTQPSNDNDRQVHLLVTDLKCTNLPVMDSELMGGLSDPYVLFVSSPKKLLWQKAWPSTKILNRNLNPVWDEDIHLVLDSETIESGGQPSLAGAMLYLTVMDYDISSGDDVIGTVALNLSNLCSNIDLGTNTDANASNGRMTMGRRTSADVSSQSLMSHRKLTTDESNPHDELTRESSRRRRSSGIVSLMESKQQTFIQETTISRPIMRNGQEYGRLDCTILAGYLTPRETRGFLRITKKLGKTNKQSSAMTLKNKISSFLPF